MLRLELQQSCSMLWWPKIIVCSITGLKLRHTQVWLLPCALSFAKRGVSMYGLRSWEMLPVALEHSSAESRNVTTTRVRIHVVTKLRVCRFRFSTAAVRSLPSCYLLECLETLGISFELRYNKRPQILHAVCSHCRASYDAWWSRELWKKQRKWLRD